MKIALVTPTRGRPERFRQMAQSALTLAKDQERVFIIGGVDADDPMLKGYLPVTDPAVWVRRYEKRKTVPYIYNELAHDARVNGADVVMMTNDDVLFRTKHWDELLAKYVGMYPDKLVCVAPNDECHSGKANFWFVTREWINAVGYFCWPEFEHFCGDTMTELIAKKAGRFIYAADITCEHMHPKYGKAPNDETYRACRVRGADGTNASDRDIARMKALNGEMNQAANRIHAAIAAHIRDTRDAA